MNIGESRISDNWIKIHYGFEIQELCCKNKLSVSYKMLTACVNAILLDKHCSAQNTSLNVLWERHKPKTIAIDVLLPVVQKIFETHPNIRKEDIQVDNQKTGNRSAIVIEESSILPVKEMNEMHYTTGLLRFPHLYEHILSTMTFRQRYQAHVCIIGPGMLCPEEVEEQVPGFENTIIVPQLSESGQLFPKSKRIVIEKPGKVWDLLMETESSTRFIAYPQIWGLNVLKENNFNAKAKGYPLLTNLMQEDPVQKSSTGGGETKYRLFDLDKCPLTARFDVIFLTKVLCHIVEEDPKNAQTIFINSLKGLKKSGKLYIDEMSLNNLAALANMSIPNLLKFLENQLNNNLQATFIPHHVVGNNLEGIPVICHTISKNRMNKTQTDNIYEIKLRS